MNYIIIIIMIIIITIIVRLTAVLNMIWLLFTVTDISTTCAVVIFRVAVVFVLSIKDIAEVKLYLFERKR